MLELFYTIPVHFNLCLTLFNCFVYPHLNTVLPGCIIASSQLLNLKTCSGKSNIILTLLDAIHASFFILYHILLGPRSNFYGIMLYVGCKMAVSVECVSFYVIQSHAAFLFYYYGVSCNFSFFFILPNVCYWDFKAIIVLCKFSLYFYLTFYDVSKFN